jgi:hypothetical protein
LAVAQILLDCPSERRFLRFAMCRLSHLFPYMPKQPGYNKRMRRLAPQIVRLLNSIAFCSPSWCDKVRLLDSTPVPCGASRETVKRSDFAGYAGYGYCASHSRYFWVAAVSAVRAGRDAHRLLPGRRQRARTRGRHGDARPRPLRRTAHRRRGHRRRQRVRRPRVRTDRPRARRHPSSPRPPRRAAQVGKLGGIRQWIESIYQTTKSQLSLEDHGAHIPEGVWARVCQRILALAIGVWHSWQPWEAGIVDTPGRHFTSYDH